MYQKTVLLLYFMSLVYSSPTFYPTMIPTPQTQVPTTTPTHGCDDSLEYTVTASTGFTCSYYVSIGGVCEVYFCDTCLYPYHYCSETCGYCTSSPTPIPSLTQFPTITSSPTTVPISQPTPSPSMSTIPSPSPTMIPTPLPTITSAPTIDHFYVTNNAEFTEALASTRITMTIELMTSHMMITSSLQITNGNLALSDPLRHQNVTIHSTHGTVLEGVGVFIMNFVSIQFVSIENVVFFNGTALQTTGGGLTLASVRHVRLLNVSFIKNDCGPLITPYGGGLTILSAQAELMNCSFIDNWCYFGGGMLITKSSSSGDIFDTSIIGENLKFQNNRAVVLNNGLSTSGGYAGAVYIAGGSEVKFTEVEFDSNYAARQYLDMWVSDGSFVGVDLTFSAKTEATSSHVGVDDGNALSCGPSCDEGSYGNCSLNILDLCYANCGNTCQACAAGKANSVSQSAGSDSCIDCAPGFVSYSGASSCDICSVGKYATNGSTMVSGLSLAGAAVCAECEAGYYQPVQGGLQCVLCSSGTSSGVGASSCSTCEAGRYAQAGSDSCTDCVAGTYASTSGSDSCSKCPSFQYSKIGAISCPLAATGYYFPLISSQLSSTVITECPTHSQCDGGYHLPIPSSGYWIERRAYQYSDKLSRCSRNTCKGGMDLNIMNGTSCWSTSFYNTTWLRKVTNEEKVCDRDLLMCTQGASGPLCGACDEDYIYSSTRSTCITCQAATRGALYAIAFCVLLLTLTFIIYSYRRVILVKYEKWWLVGMASNIDDGAFRVLWGVL